ncbi:MAG TPA: SCO family protein [Methylophilaceae bacterium]|nr:SCO family protein [Methylophilaceae bacterium]
MRRFSGVIACLAIIAALVGCNANKEPSLYGTDITGASFASSLSLTDHTGKPRTLDDFKGKVVVLFFGYTHCPDVCPTTMADLAKAMKLMGPKSDEVQVLFVTVDPERDTQQVLADYVPSFDPRFIGLRGTPEQLAETAKNFKIFYSKQESAGKSDYTIDHSAGTYVFDKQGHVRIYIKYGEKPQEIAHDLKTLL